MQSTSYKQEIIEWISKLDDPVILNYLKLLKESSAKPKEAWNDLPPEAKESISRGLEDARRGNTLSNDEFWAQLVSD